MFYKMEKPTNKQASIINLKQVNIASYNSTQSILVISQNNTSPWVYKSIQLEY